MAAAAYHRPEAAYMAWPVKGHTYHLAMAYLSGVRGRSRRGGVSCMCVVMAYCRYYQLTAIMA